MASSLHYYRPMTPPASATAVQFAGNLHRRTVSGSSSVYTTDESSPDSAVTNLTTPGRSPAYRQHGPALLPKIRLQDVVVEPISHSGPHRHRRVLSSTANPPGFFPYPTTRPAVQRPVLSPVDCSVISPISASPLTAGSHFSSTLTSPVVFTPSHAFPPSRRRSGGHSRSQSASTLDDALTRRYNSSVYAQQRPPSYVSDYSPLPTPVTGTSFVYPTFHPAVSDLASYAPVSQPSVPTSPVGPVAPTRTPSRRPRQEFWEPYLPRPSISILQRRLFSVI
jgi:hypothetical protein